MKQLRCHTNFEKTQLGICTRFKREILFFRFSFVQNILVLTTQIEALMTQLRNMRRKWKQKRRNLEITEILKRRNFEADAERGDANRGISVIMSTNKI